MTQSDIFCVVSMRVYPETTYSQITHQNIFVLGK